MEGNTLLIAARGHGKSLRLANKLARDHFMKFDYAEAEILIAAQPEMKEFLIGGRKGGKAFALELLKDAQRKQLDQIDRVILDEAHLIETMQKARAGIPLGAGNRAQRRAAKKAGR